MDYLETRVNECMLKMMGAIYLEQELGEPKDQSGKDALVSVNKLSKALVDELNAYYEAMKADKRFSDNRKFLMLQRLFEAQNDEVEKAKKLLESLGYKVAKTPKND